MQVRNAWLAAALAVALPTFAATPVDLTTLDREMTGPRTQVLVLGSVHLSEIKGGIQPGALEPLLARLAAYKPDIITIENIDGEQCDLAARHPTVYGDDYCADTDDARAATGLQIPAARPMCNGCSCPPASASPATASPPHW